jgi:hypothetical protein
MPAASPIWRNVLLIPDAMPARRGCTTPTAVDASGVVTSPTPAPTTINPGSGCVHREPLEMPRISISPVPMRMNPGPTNSRVGTFAVSRPATPAVRKIAPLSASSRTPVPTAENPSTFCRYSTRNVIIDNAEAEIANADPKAPIATYRRKLPKREPHETHHGLGFMTLLSDGRRLTGAYALGPEAGEWLQQATVGIRAHVPVDVLSDTMQPFPSFSGIYEAALRELRMAIADMPRPMKPMESQMASLPQ